MAECDVTAYADGHAVAHTDCPEEYVEKVKSAVRQSMRIQSYIDRDFLLRTLVESGVPVEVARVVAAQTRIRSDAAVYAVRPRG